MCVPSVMCVMVHTRVCVCVLSEMQGNIPLEIQHLKEIVTAYGANNLAAGPAARALKRKAAALNRQKNYVSVGSKQYASWREL